MIPFKLHFKNKAGLYIESIGILSALAGILVLIGWYLDSHLLKTFGLGSLEMKPASAVFFIFAGLNIIFLQKDKQIKYSVLARVISVTIILLCTFVVFQYSFKTKMDITNLVDYNGSLAYKKLFTLKISFNSILSFTLIGLTLIIFSFKLTKIKLLVLFFSILGLSISFIGFINYAFGLTEITGLPEYTKMPGNTSLLSVMLGVGMLLMIRKGRKIRQSIENMLLFGITLASVLIIFGSIISISSIKSLVSASKRAEQSQEVKLELRNVLLMIYEFTSNKYGYLISDDDLFLDNQDLKKANINNILIRIEALIQDNPKQKERIFTLKQLTKEHIEYSELLINTKKTKESELSNEIFVSLRKNQILDKMSTIVSQMLIEEDRNLKERKKIEAENVINILLIIIISLSVQLILMGFIFLFVRRDIAARKRAKNELVRINVHLDKIVKERTHELESTITELEISKEKAEASNHLKTAFLNNISHEIRTPLNGILGFAPFIIQPDCSIEEKEMYLEILNKSSRRLINTITDYTDISMIVSGTMETSFKDVDISSLIVDTHKHFKLACQKKNLKLNIQLPENEYKYKLITDRYLLGKLLRHLVDNAIKFTHSGSIIIGAKFIGNMLEIYVEDSGQGIANNEQKRIFDFFMQEYIENTRGHEGSGLGLSIVKGITQLLGGKLRLDSVKNKGTTVFVNLPVEVVVTS